MKSVTIILSFFILSFSIYAQNTLVVEPSGGGDYLTVSEAITNAIEGDTIKVMNGRYLEILNINKKLNFVGEDNDSTIIEYTDGVGIKFLSGSNGSSFQNFKVKARVNFNTDVGAIITNNKFYDDHFYAEGILKKLIIHNNEFYNYFVKVRGQENGQVIVSYNQFEGGEDQLHADDNTVVIGNNFSNANGNSIIVYRANNIKVMGNSISNAKNAIYLNYTETGGAFQKIVVNNNVLQYSNNGLLFKGYYYYADNAKILNCQIKNNVIFENDGRGINTDNDFHNESIILIRNNIIANNIGAGLTFSNNYAIKDYNCLYSNGNNDVDGQGNIVENPMFLDPENGNFGLQINSPCINNGSPELLDYDLDRTRNDMGIYGGPHTWDNYDFDSTKPKVLDLTVTPNLLTNGTEITITGSGISGSSNSSKNKESIKPKLNSRSTQK